MNKLSLGCIAGSLALLAATGLSGASATIAAPSSHAAAPRPEGAPAQAIPDWFLRAIEEKTRDGGVWIADNANYREADGGIEAFGLHWTKGLGGKSMIGRLFSLRGGEELATHWEFRAFWHPVEKVVRIYQFGVDGTVGWGEVAPGDEEGFEVLEQTFAGPDGGQTRVRHETRTDGDRETGTSFDWVDGRWEPRRTYTWVRQR